MRRITQCHNKQLLAICQGAILFDDLNRKLKPLLPENLREHCLVGSFTKGCLILVTSKPAFATELRYCLPTLRDTLRTNGGLHQLISIKIQIVEDHCPSSTKAAQPEKTLSGEAQKAVQDAAEQCTYPPLKEILLRLAYGSNSPSTSTGTSS